MISKQVFYEGRVQGVGFRWTVKNLAKGYDVTGTVENLADGRVQLDAEGEPRDIRAFVAAIEERMHGYIRRVDRKSAKRTPEFSDFRIQ